MLFNTPAFVFAYLPIVLAGAFVLGRIHHRLAVIWLALSSLAFYGVWDVRFIPLLVASVVFNYTAGYWIAAARAERKPGAKARLAIAIAINLAVLCYFKYSNFFLSSSNEWFGTHFPALRVVLPLGISFFTFTQITFLVDVHRGIAREYSFFSYLLFVTYFPHLIAGPVLHHKQMMPQFADARTFRVNHAHLAVGLTIFILGLAKKVIVADELAPIATATFDLAAQHPEKLHLFQAWLGALNYTLQLYFDFSGYSDMAIGLSLLFNVHLPLNFNSPYKATSIIDFWRRWHMTLSEFLRSYLYVPLGGNRKGPARRYGNLMITMVLGGLWHGAGWTYVVWGALHGVYLMINHGWRALQSRTSGTSGSSRRSGRTARGLPTWLAGALTFLAVVIGWVVFRANDLSAARAMLASMFLGNGVSLPPRLAATLGSLAVHLPGLHITFDGLASATGDRGPIVALVLVAAGLVAVWAFPNVNELLSRCYPARDEELRPAVPPPSGWPARKIGWKLTPPFAVMAAGLFLISVLIMLSSKASEFLYFQF
jgi:alginate O-acetyltransferase complex protein AlgI